MTVTNYTYYQSPIGILKIGGTGHYICELSFVEVGTKLTYPAENTITPVMQQCTEQLIEFFNGERRYFDVPVHQPGTEFQQSVWNELLNIPFGKTVTYLDLAKKLGNADAIRAVAASNAKNKICIIVPCHRVIGTNKSLIGYIGGLPRKKWLLQHEFHKVHGIQTLF